MNDTRSIQKENEQYEDKKWYSSKYSLCFIGMIILVFASQYAFFVKDQRHYFIQIAKRYIPDFIPNDWFTWQVTHYHIIFGYIFSFIRHIIPLEYLFFILYLILSYILVLYIYNISQFFSKDKRLFWIILIFSIFSTYFGIGKHRLEIGSTRLFSEYITPRDIGMVCTLIMVYYLMKFRSLKAGFFAGCATLIHINFLFITSIISFSYFLLSSSQKVFFKNLICFFTPFLILSLPNIVILTKDFVQKSTIVHSSVDFDVLFDSISPAHFNPAYFQLEAVIIVIIVCIGAFVSYHYTDKTQDINHCIKLIYTILFILGVTLVCSIKAIRVDIIVNMFLWPLAPILVLLCFTLLMRNLINILTANKWILFFIIMIFFFVLGVLPLKGHFLYTHLIAIILICGGLFLVVRKSYNFWVSSIFFIVAAPFWCHFQLPQITTKMDSQIDMFLHCREFSSPDSNFLIHPELYGFRIVAERATFVDRFCMPRKLNDLQEWIRRLQIIYNVQEVKEIWEKDFEDVHPEYIKILVKKYNFTHFVTSTSHKHLNKFLGYGFQILYQNEDYILFATTPQKIKRKDIKEDKEKHLLLIRNKFMK